MSTRETKTCPNCGINYWHGRRDKIYCSRECKTAYYLRNKYKNDEEYKEHKLELNKEYRNKNKKKDSGI